MDSRTETHLRQRVGGVRAPPFRVERGRRAQGEDVRIRRIQEMRQTGLRAQEAAAAVDLLHQVEALHRRVQRAAQPDRAGVVDQDVDAAEGIDGGGHRGAHLLLFADVALERQRAPACGLDRRRGAVDGARQFGIGHVRLGGNGDVGTVAGGAQGDGQADPARGTGDEQSLAGKRGHGHPPWLQAAEV